MKRAVVALTGLLLTLPVVAGCAAPASSAGFDVVTSFYPLQFLAQRIGGGHAHVENLTSPGKEPHDLELSVQQTADVETADVVIYEAALQPSVAAAVRTTKPKRSIDAGRVAGLEGNDPHFWLDPMRMVTVAAALESQMAAADPSHRAAYARNLATLRKQLISLDQAYRTGLAHCRVTTAVVSHDAYSYLAKYGLSFAPIVGLNPDAEPSPARLAALAKLMDSKGITTVFYEPLGSPDTADTLANATGTQTAVLDPIEGLSNQTANQDYLSLMRADLAALRKAGGCR